MEGGIPPVPTRLSGVPSCFRPPCSVKKSDFGFIAMLLNNVLTSGLVLVSHCDDVGLV
jgi:hypothetical protein